MPQLSAEELRAAEAESSYTVQQGVAAAVALYLCTLCLVVHMCQSCVARLFADCCPIAPFVIDAFWKIF